MTKINNLNDIVNNGLCIGCGLCQSITGKDSITACDTYTWMDGVTYTASNNTATHTLTAANGCDSVVSLDLTIITSPTVDLGNDVSICAGASTTLAASGANSYTWNNDPTLSSLIINNPVATPTVTTTYTVTGTDVNGCSGSDNVLVTVTPIEDASFNSRLNCTIEAFSHPQTHTSIDLSVRPAIVLC